MNDTDFKYREKERAKRLFHFVDGELANMTTEARFDFVLMLLLQFKPEVDELARQGKIEEK